MMESIAIRRVPTNGSHDDDMSSVSTSTTGTGNSGAMPSFGRVNSRIRHKRHSRGISPPSLSDHFQKEQPTSSTGCKSLSDDPPTLATELMEDSFSLESSNKSWKVRAASGRHSFRPNNSGGNLCDIEDEDCSVDVPEETEESAIHEEELVPVDISKTDSTVYSLDSELNAAIQAALLARKMTALNATVDSTSIPEQQPQQDTVFSRNLDALASPSFVQERTETFQKNLETIASADFVQERMDTFHKNMETISSMLWWGKKAQEETKPFSKAKKSWLSLEETAMKGHNLERSMHGTLILE